MLSCIRLASRPSRSDKVAKASSAVRWPTYQEGTSLVSASIYRAHKHFQFLTADTGNPQLDRQISTVTTLMRIAADKHEFEDLFERAFAKQMRLPLVIPVPPDDETQA